MLRTRLAAVVFGSALAAGGVAATTAAAQTTDPNPPAPSETETQLPQSGGPVTITVAGVGTVSFNVDPTTGAITDVVVTPLDGVTVGTPVVTEEGIKIDVTSADGTVRVLEISAKPEDGGLEVETELETGDDQAGAPEAPESGDNQGNDNQGSEDGGTTPPTAAPGGSESGDGGGSDGGSQTTTPTTGGGGEQPGDGGGSDSGGDGGGGQDGGGQGSGD